MLPKLLIWKEGKERRQEIHLCWWVCDVLSGKSQWPLRNIWAYVWTYRNDGMEERQNTQTERVLLESFDRVFSVGYTVLHFSACSRLVNTLSPVVMPLAIYFVLLSRVIHTQISHCGSFAPLVDTTIPNRSKQMVFYLMKHHFEVLHKTPDIKAKAL